MPSISLTRKLTVLIIKHKNVRKALKPVSPWLIKHLMKDYERLTSGPIKNPDSKPNRRMQ